MSETKVVRGLSCTCCGEWHRGVQWHDMDTGHGLCAKCWDWIAQRRPFGHDPMTKAEMERTYGIHGFNVIPLAQEPSK